MTDPYVAAERDARFDKWYEGYYGYRPMWIESERHYELAALNRYDVWQAAFEAGRTEGLEQAARESESFTGPLPKEKWPPHGLVAADRRFDSGVSDMTAKNITAAIRSLNCKP